MKGDYAKCNITSRGAWQKFKEVNIEGLDNLTAINKHNLENWYRITGTNNMPKMIQLSWSQLTGNSSQKQQYDVDNPDFIPEEFIVFYSCDYLRPKKSNNYSRKDILCKKYGLYGWSKGNTKPKGPDNPPDFLNNLSCKDPCIKYKRCYGYNCCNVYNKWTDSDELVYCEQCKGMKTTIIAFNLFEIMRQILVSKCAIGKKNLLPYLLNPVTQQPFSEDELNNFAYLFKTAVSNWKQNTNITNSFIRRNVQRITTYVTPALLVTSLLATPGGQAAAIISLMSSIVWTIGYVENIENIWELEKITGNFKNGDKEYILASSKVLMASAEALVFTLVNTGFARETYSRFRALGSSKISGPLLRNQIPKGMSSDLLQLINKINLFDYGIPLIGNVVTGEILHSQLRNIAFSGFGSLIYKANKLKAVSSGKLKPSSFDQFDHKLNSIIIKEQEIRAQQLPINISFLDDSTKNPFIENFCSILSTTVERFKKISRLNKINRTLKKNNSSLTNFQRIGKNILLDVHEKRSKTITGAGGGTKELYTKIVNPKTGRQVSIYGKLGKTILRNYINRVNN